jgi:hypothetical protein
MPRFDPNLADRDQTIDRIIAYLQGMAREDPRDIPPEPTPDPK